MRGAALLLAAGFVLTSCHRQLPREATGADPEHGRLVIAAYDCGACHTVPGVRAARGLVGPSLDAFAHRSFIGGVLPHTRENLVAWIRDPLRIEPDTAMPDLGLTETEARDVAAYLDALE